MKRARHEMEGQALGHGAPSGTGVGSSQPPQGQVTAAFIQPAAATASGTQKSSPDSEGRNSLKAPKISRKVRACTECQNRKIKCDLTTGQTVCSRCSRMSLRCVVNKSLQSLLEEETEWKTSMENQSQQLQAAVAEILKTLGLQSLDTFSANATKTEKSPTQAELDQANQERYSPTLLGTTMRKLQATGMAMTRESSQEPQIKEELDNETIVAAPMGSLYEVTKLRNLRSNPVETPQQPKVARITEDFISRGHITEVEANDLFEYFKTRLNPYLWGGIALIHDDLASVRSSSSLLSAAILTVAALHIPGKTDTFDTCYRELLALVCDSMLVRFHTFDGVRGLAIGAFWLSDVSWKLSGHAVRIATELNLHQSYSKVLRGKMENFEGARLWYFLYVCDHHFSIAYGRPPVIHEDATITYHERFLQLPGIKQADFRLHSQVALFIILTRMYNTFGGDLEQTLNDVQLHDLRRFNQDLDEWKSTWSRYLATDQYINAYPTKGVTLHHYFSKLQLNALALRSIPRQSQPLSPIRREFAMVAINSAIGTLKTVLQEPDIRNGLVGVPLYLHTMITFAAVFLLKVYIRWKAEFGSDDESDRIRELITRIITLLKDAKASDRHLTKHIGSGLSKMLGRFIAWEKEAQDIRDGIMRSMTPTQVLGHHGHTSFAIPDPGYEIPVQDGLFGMYGATMDLYDENYFPVGFFDVLTS